MDESQAWLLQARSDREAAERAGGDGGSGMRCHRVAKCQQAVEKAVKAIVAALREVGATNVQIGYAHDVTRFMSVLLRGPRGTGDRTVQRHLSNLLESNTRARIRALELLTPRQPPPGGAPGRNTEYPFRDAGGSWTYPAAEGTFSATEVNGFQTLANRIVGGAGRIVSVIRRGPGKPMRRPR